MSIQITNVIMRLNTSLIDTSAQDFIEHETAFSIDLSLESDSPDFFQSGFLSKIPKLPLEDSISLPVCNSSLCQTTLQLKPVSVQYKCTGRRCFTDLNVFHLFLTRHVFKQLESNAFNSIVDTLLSKADFNCTRVLNSHAEIVEYIAAMSLHLVLINPDDMVRLFTLKDSQGQYVLHEHLLKDLVQFMPTPAVPRGKFYAFDPARSVMIGFYPKITLSCGYRHIGDEYACCITTNWKVGAVVDNPSGVKSGNLKFL